MDFFESSGRNPIADWLEGFPADVQAKISERLLTMEGLPKWPEKWASDYKGSKGLYEVRITFKKVQYRPLYTYAPGKQVILLCGSIEKDDALPRADVETAERRRKDWLKDPSRVVRHRF